jgi:hypothetical protein
VFPYAGVESSAELGQVHGTHEDVRRPQRQGLCGTVRILAGQDHYTWRRTVVVVSGREQLGAIAHIRQRDKNGIRSGTRPGALRLHQLEPGTSEGMLHSFGPGGSLTEQKNTRASGRLRNLLAHTRQRGE